MSKTQGTSTVVKLAMISLGLVLAIILADQQFRERQSEENYKLAHAELEVVAANFRTQLSSNIQLAQGLTSLIALNPDLTQADFSRAAEPLLDGNDVIKNLGLAPDLIIRIVYPYEGNEKAVGVDYRNIPEQFATAKEARETGEVVLTGPINLIQGGQGLIARVPVFLNSDAGERYFWGLNSVVMDFDRLLEMSGAKSLAAQYPLLIQAVDDRGESQRVIFGELPDNNSDAFLDSYDVQFPGGRWRFQLAESQSSTFANQDLWLFRVFLLGIALLIFLPSLKLIRELKARRVVQSELTEMQGINRLALNSADIAVYRIDLKTGFGELISGECPLFDSANNRNIYEVLSDYASEQSVGRVETSRLNPNSKATVAMHDRDTGSFSNWVTFIHSAPYERDGERYQILLRQRVTDMVESERKADAALRELKEKSLQQEQLFAIIGHELRTPAAAIKMLLEDNSEPPVSGHAGAIMDTTNHLLDVLDDMRVVIHPEEAVKGKVVSLVVPTLVESCKLLLGRILIESELRVHVSADQDGHRAVLANEQLLRQILLNLIKNAAYHAKASDLWIKVRCQPIGDRLAFDLIFEDNGVGIPEAYQTRIFDAFERAESEADGTGLGLHISRTYARKYFAGNLTYEDVESGGARFTLTLKLQLDMQEQQQTENLISETADKVLEGLTILVAEDSDLLRMTLVKALEKQGARVVAFENGKRALENAKEQLTQGAGYDLYVTDIFMPEMNGYELTRELRDLGINEPIIGLTAAVVGDEQSKLILAGADKVMAKPLNTQAFKLVVDQLISKSEQTS